MKHIRLSIINNNLMLKITALILAILCWLKISYQQSITCKVELPLSFYNAHTTKIQAPETVIAHIRGKRNALYRFDPSCAAVHIDAHNLSSGKYMLPIQQEKLFLPEGIDMVNYVPCTIEVSYT